MSFDTASKELYNMGEEGLGDTSDFIWDNTKDVLYSISGTEENKQLMLSDFTKEDHTPEALEEEGMESGRLDFGAGKLYVEDEDQGQIFEFDIASKTRKKLADGMGFLLSPDAKYIAYFKTESQPEAAASDEESTDEDPSELLDFMLMDTATGTEKTVVTEAGIPYEACAFSADSQKIYFINQNAVEDDAEVDNLYPNQLFAYDIASGQTNVAFKTGAESFSIAKDNKLYLNCTLLSGENGLDLTYCL